MKFLHWLKFSSFMVLKYITLILVDQNLLWLWLEWCKTTTKTYDAVSFATWQFSTLMTIYGHLEHLLVLKHLILKATYMYFSRRTCIYLYIPAEIITCNWNLWAVIFYWGIWIRMHTILVTVSGHMVARIQNHTLLSLAYFYETNL